MTWTRHRPKALSWALLLAFVLVIVVTVQRFVFEVSVADDLIGLALRLAVGALIVATYLRTGGSTTASGEGLIVHNGIRASEIPAAAVAKIEEDARRGGALAVLTTGRRVELPGVATDDIRTLRKQLRRR